VIDEQARDQDDSCYAKTRYPKGYLMEEYLALSQGKTNGKRLMDGVIVFRKPCVKRNLI